MQTEAAKYGGDVVTDLFVLTFPDSPDMEISARVWRRSRATVISAGPGMVAERDSLREAERFRQVDLEARATRGDTSAIRLIVAKEPGGGPVLARAIDAGNFLLTLMFFAAGATAKDMWDDPYLSILSGIGTLAGRGDAAMIEMLLDYGLPFSPKPGSRSLLHYAAAGPQPGIASKSPTIGSLGPAASRQEALIKLLLARRIPVDVRDENSATPLMWAVRNGRLEAVQRLLDAGADPNARSQKSIGNDDAAALTPLAIANEAVKREPNCADCARVLRLLQSHGARA